jgi:hypothetical protein
MLRSLVRVSALSVAVAGVYLGCGGDGTTEPPPEEPRATQAVAASGNAQNGIVGQVLAAPLVVQINDQSGQPMSGVGVSFTVSAGNGAVSSATATTDAGGQASTDWTLGTVAGSSQQVTAAVAGATNISATFSASAAADVPYVISMVSGDDQFAFKETKLPDVIAVKVRDQYANDVQGQIVAFTVPTGRGSVDSTVAFTNTIGEAVTGWAVGAIVGEDTAFATVSGVVGSPVVFTATVHDLQLTSVFPTTIQLGGNATLTGTGFDATPANNTVVVGDLTATVNSATTTQLDITIPDACRPFGPANVSVTVGGIPSAPVSAGLTPTAFLDLAVGEQEIVQDPSDFCLQFDETVASESYLIGVQSTSEAVSTITPIKFSSFASAGSSGPPAFFTAHTDASGGQSRRILDRARQARINRHRAVESGIRAFDRLNFDRIRSEWVGPQRTSASGAAAIDSNVTVGDTIAVRVTTGDGTCNTYDSVTTIVTAVGAKGIWLEDVENPSGGYTSNDYETLSQQFDDIIYPVDTAQFGGPSDADDNGRIVMVITRRVNERGSLGFTTSCDFGARSQSNLGSNEGEYFYGEAPDPNGELGDEIALEDALAWSPAISAHELVHVIQISGRAAAGGSFPSIWIAEGQATLGEEVVGYAAEGRVPGQNLPLEVALNWDDTTSFDWYSDQIVDLGLYFGWAPTDADANIHLDEAPHECTWLDNDNGGPCFEGREAYGVPWSLLRWLSDQYGQSYGGGEAGLHQDIVRGSINGFALLEQLVEQPIETLLAQWAATLYVDDRLDGVNPTLEMTSWDLYDIFYGSHMLSEGEFGLIPSLRLTPENAEFTSSVETASVRAGSTYYTLLSGDNRLGTAIWVSDASDHQLPSHMQVWVVRMQ